MSLSTEQALSCRHSQVALPTSVTFGDVGGNICHGQVGEIPQKGTAEPVHSSRYVCKAALLSQNLVDCCLSLSVLIVCFYFILQYHLMVWQSFENNRWNTYSHDYSQMLEHAYQRGERSLL